MTPSSIVQIVFALDLPHLDNVEDDQRDKDVDRALLREPEAQRVSAKHELIEEIPEQNSRTERDNEPDAHQGDEQANIFLPVGAFGLTGFRFGLTGCLFFHVTPPTIPREDSAGLPSG